MNAQYFSKTYWAARRRFLEAAYAIDAQVHTFAVTSSSAEDLALDVVVLGAENAPTLVVSSGVHGIEGFFGSAVQLALLERLGKDGCQGSLRYVLIHAVNPFGFAHLRRANEDNVDLNRNFLTSSDNYSGAPSGYARLNGLLNPQSPPSRLEPFKLKALWNIGRTGLQTLKQAVAGGQYAYPQGLFFGGTGPSTSTQIVQDNCDSWLATAQQIMHIDFHTGLGPFAGYKLLVSESMKSERYARYVDAFGSEYVESPTLDGGTAYTPSGSLGEWLKGHFSARDYRFVAAEFGTFDLIRVLGALRTENRAHYFCSKGSLPYRQAKDELLECFCPASLSWRRQVVDSGLKIIDRGSQSLIEPSK